MPARAHCGRPWLAGDQRDLSDEVAWAELVDHPYALDDVGLAFYEDDELPTVLALPRDVAGGWEVEFVREHRDLRELSLRAALEQRNPLQQLDLRVFAQHRPRYSLLHVPIRCNKARRIDRRRGPQPDREAERHALP